MHLKRFGDIGCEIDDVLQRPFGIVRTIESQKNSAHIGPPSNV
jgi:hypothetical protein